jgi:cardiolipin synthase
MTVALTPANQLTLLRMLLIPVIAIQLIYGYIGLALVVFCVAGVTDLLDGLIARWSGQKTELGAWLDPMADKLLLVTTFIVLTLPLDHMPNRLPVWLTVLMISRDVGIVATVAIVNLAVGRRTFMPSILGKIATATFILTGIATLFFNYLGQRSGVVDAFVYASLAATVVSSLHYIWQAMRGGGLGAGAAQSAAAPSAVQAPAPSPVPPEVDPVQAGVAQAAAQPPPAAPLPAAQPSSPDGREDVRVRASS